ncbi:MAG: hypothetical protein ABSH47_19110 [Bryobacteraceae bacterium]|jgi:hypothetical protein
MTSLTCPAARPATGFPNAMPDIIDSLKRLERIGDEHSKTVQKILDAALEVERAIGIQYENSGDVILSGSSILKELAEDRGSQPEEAARALGVDYLLAANMCYKVSNDASRGFMIHNVQTGDRVSSSRSAALAFSSDLVAGLLVLVVQDLLQRQKENTLALESLSKARSVFGVPAE